MRFAVVSLKRTKTGLWSARKAIPNDIRAAYGKREEKKTWPASLSAGQAKAELAAWLVPIEERVALLRGAASSTPLAFTKRQCRALAGEWYQERVGEQEARFTDSSTVWDWDADIEAILPDGEEYEPGITPLRPIPVIVEERDELLRARGLLLDAQSAERLLQEMLDLYLEFLRLMQRRVAGDFGPDPVLQSLPTHEGSPDRLRQKKPAVSILGLFEEFAASGTATPHTVTKWRAAIDSFVEHLGHDDATKVARTDAHAWFNALLARGLSVRTVRGTYRSALARIFKIAFDRGRLEANPIVGLEVIGPKAVQTKRKEINDSEAEVILKAALVAVWTRLDSNP